MVGVTVPMVEVLDLALMVKAMVMVEDCGGGGRGGCGGCSGGDEVGCSVSAGCGD